MPKIEVGERRKTARERLKEIRQMQQDKQGRGQKLTVADLVERVEALEAVVLDRS